MLNSEALRLVTAYASDPKDGFKGINGCPVGSVSNSMNVDLESCIGPLPMISSKTLRGVILPREPPLSTLSH
jgi:hypothetical protein